MEEIGRQYLRGGKARRLFEVSGEARPLWRTQCQVQWLRLPKGTVLSLSLETFSAAPRLADNRTKALLGG